MKREIISLILPTLLAMLCTSSALAKEEIIMVAPVGEHASIDMKP